MCASPLSLLRAGPPPPRVSLLPDAVFFSRSLAVPAGATRDEVVAQVSVALESFSPFPLSQLYFGYFWPEGADRALAFASYKRRFTAEQLHDWSGAEHVMPAFAAILGGTFEPATTVILDALDGLTALHWEKGPVPALVLHQPLAPDTTDNDRAQAREALIRSAGAARTVLDAPSPPVAMPGTDSELVFQAGALRSVLPSATAAALDVRDRADLVALARARRRDVILWRTAIGALAACAVFCLAELALLGGGLWQTARITKLAAQRPTVSRIAAEQDLAQRIDDLSTKRLLPMEMISVVSPAAVMPKDTPSIQFLHASTVALNTIQVEAQTNNPGEIAGYKAALERTPGCDHVEIRDQRSHDNLLTFTLIVTFRPGAITPATS